MRSFGPLAWSLPTDDVAPINASARGAAALMRGTAAMTSSR